MAQSIRASWFGRQIVILTVNDKSISGTVTEATDSYIVLADAKGVETQVMSHAVVAIKLAPAQGEAQS